MSPLTTVAVELFVRSTMVLEKVSVKPQPIFGSNVLQRLANGAAFIGLILCAIGVVMGGATWFMGSRGGNSAFSSNGKNMVFGGIIGAVVIGAAAGIVNFGYVLGGSAR